MEKGLDTYHGADKSKMIRKASIDIMADIVAALQKKPRSKAELCREVDAHFPSVKRCMDSLLRRGLIVNGQRRRIRRKGGQEQLYKWRR